MNVADAIESLSVDGNEATEVAGPTEDEEHDLLESLNCHLIRDGSQVDHHIAHVTSNRAQNQPFGGSCFDHPSGLLGPSTPDFLTLSAFACQV